MWVSPSNFRRGLYAEHHEEAAFLYTQIRRLRDAESVAFGRLADFESRIGAHLDALLIGGPLAMSEVKSRHDGDDAGHWYVAALLVCARRETQQFEALLWGVAENGSNDAARALADALRHAMPAEWSSLLRRLLAETQEPVLGWLADVASHLVPACRDVLERRLQATSHPSAMLVRASGRAGAVGASNWLARCAEDGPSRELRRQALLAMAELGAPQAPSLARQFIETPEVSHLAIGLVGDWRDAHALLRLNTAQLRPDSLLALGLLGDLAAVRPLVGLLEHPDLGAAAATALDWITGAGLTETAIEVDEDDNGDEAVTDASEYRRLRPGQRLARRADGQAYGTRMERLARDAGRWNAWLTAAAPRFKAGARFRFGRISSLRWLVQVLADETRSVGYRRLACDELSMRHAAPYRLDPHASVAHQRATLRQLLAWAESLGEQHPSGNWSYAGVAV